MKYLDLDIVIELHNMQIKKYGGTLGVLDKGLLEHLCVAPRQTFSSVDLYKTIFDKAAKYFVGFSTSQVFEDGNKRTATACLTVFLDLNGYKLNCTEAQLTDLCLKVSTNQKSQKDVVSFLKSHTQVIK